MKTAGQILKETRSSKNLEIEQIAHETKILPLYLQALEEDDYQKLPSFTTARGFLKNYAEYLDLPSENVLAVFRRDFNDKKAEGDFLKTNLAVKPKFNWTPRITTLVAVGIMVLLFIIYLVWQYRSLISAPYY